METALDICDHEMQAHGILTQELSNSEFYVWTHEN